MKARSSASPFGLAPLALLALLLAPVPAPAAVLPKLTVEQDRLRAFPLRDASQPPASGTRTASGSSSCAAPARRRASTRSTAPKGETRLLLDGAKTLIPGEKPRPLPLGSSAWLPDGDTLLVPPAATSSPVDVRTGAVRALVETPDTEEHAEASPDGKRVAFVRKGDLWVVEVATGRETRLTQGGSETLLNGKLDWVYEEELASRSGQAFALVARLTAPSPTSSSTSRRVADLPHRGLRPGPQRGRLAALPQGRRPERDRAPGGGRPREGRHARGRSGSSPSPRTTSTSCPSSAGRRTPRTSPSST